MVSAVAGRSFDLLLRLVEGGLTLMAPAQQWAETRRVLVAKLRLPEVWVDGQMERLAELVVAIDPAMIERHRDRAQRRLRSRAQPDWPVLAASYAADAAVWSHDKDFFGTGAPVWSTRVLASEADMLPRAANGK